MSGFAQYEISFPIIKVYSKKQLALHDLHSQSSHISFDSVQTLFFTLRDLLNKSSFAFANLPNLPNLETITIRFYENDSLILRYIQD